MEYGENFNHKLVTLLKMFNNRPYHLAKYLIDNSALNRDFIEKINKSDKLSESPDDSYTILPVYFVDISQMNEFYNSFIEQIKQIANDKNSDIEYEINKKLNECIRDERYEEAARIRDYMIKNGIRKIDL